MATVGRPERVPGTSAELGESPVWDPRIARLRWVDLFAGVLHATDPTTGADESVRVDGVCGFVALADDGIVHAVGSRIVHRSSIGVREVASEESHLQFNDSQVSPGGWLFAGLFATDRTARLEAGRLVRVGADGALSVVSTGITLTNGMGWSPAGDVMFHVDMPLGRVDRYDFDAATGSARHRRPAFAIDGPGTPDGMAVDAEGRVWIAMWGTPTVRAFDEGGREVARIDLPVANVTSCAFGGPDLSTLYVTTSTRGATPEQRDAGAVFAVATDTRGQAPRYFGRSASEA